MGNAGRTRSNDLSLGHAHSSDGLTWTEHPANPILPANEVPLGKDWHTPHVLYDGERYLLYYAARDLGNLYGAGDGTLRADGGGIYRHIGVASCPKQRAAAPVHVP